MAQLTARLIRAQAMELRGTDIGERRAEELAVDVARLNQAMLGARERLEFNDEPARFTALLTAPAPVVGKRK